MIAACYPLQVALTTGPAGARYIAGCGCGWASKPSDSMTAALLARLAHEGAAIPAVLKTGKE